MPADAVSIGTLLDFANKLTVVALLVVIIYGGKNQWWVWGWQYRQVRQDADQWKQMTLRLLASTQRTVAAGERQVQVAERVVLAVQPEQLESDRDRTAIVEKMIDEMGRRVRPPGEE